MNFKMHFISFMREVFLPHHRSLEFRAKIFTAMLVAKKIITDDDYDIVRDIAIDIYKKDKRRVNVMVNTVKEFVQAIKINKLKTLDGLLKDIDRELNLINRYTQKIDFEHLRQLMINSDEDDALVQQRVYEFILNEVRIYKKKD